MQEVFENCGGNAQTAAVRGGRHADEATGCVVFAGKATGTDDPSVGTDRNEKVVPAGDIGAENIIEIGVRLLIDPSEVLTESIDDQATGIVLIGGAYRSNFGDDLRCRHGIIRIIRSPVSSGFPNDTTMNR